MMRSLHLADFLTLANAACGVAAVFCAMIFLSTHARIYFLAAALLAPAALVLDVLDGRVADGGSSNRRWGASLIRWPT